VIGVALRLLCRGYWYRLLESAPPRPFGAPPPILAGRGQCVAMSQWKAVPGSGSGEEFPEGQVWSWDGQARVFPGPVPVQWTDGYRP